jgi:hypothetical protein
VPKASGSQEGEWHCAQNGSRVGSRLASHQGDLLSEHGYLDPTLMRGRAGLIRCPGRAHQGQARRAGTWPAQDPQVLTPLWASDAPLCNRTSFPTPTQPGSALEGMSNRQSFPNKRVSTSGPHLPPEDIHHTSYRAMEAPLWPLTWLPSAH